MMSDSLGFHWTYDINLDLANILFFINICSKLVLYLVGSCRVTGRVVWWVGIGYN